MKENWIPVGEKAPPPWEDVLVWCRRRLANEEYLVWGNWHPEVSYCDKDGVFGLHVEVSHWQAIKAPESNL